MAAFLRNEVTVDRASDSTRSKRIERKAATNHVAIDLGGKESQICIGEPDGASAEERKVPTRKRTELVARWTASRS